jgi:hypothetical protein
MAELNFGDDLRRVHMFMTRGLRVSVEQSGRFGREGMPDEDLLEGFDRYVRALVAVLHIHHHGEDRLCWPFLRERLPQAPYETLIAQHATMVEDLEAAELARERRDMAALHVHLDAVNTLWLEHIEIEEGAFSVEATDRAMPPEDHRRLIGKLQRHAQLHSRPIPLVVAFTLYNLPPEERAAMAEAIPGVVTKFLLPVVWKRAWAPMKPFLLPE